MKMKNNKSPGSDGFPADFFKVFWSRLKYFVLKSLNEAFSKKELSVTMRQVILTCLPKGSKPRNLLKNWRPISLLNVTYKLGSASIANRLKHACNDIISPTQTGFLPNRFIGEGTRLIYDILQYTEISKISGLLLLIDFEKAFDSLSWHFLEQVLLFHNFGSDI